MTTSARRLPIEVDSGRDTQAIDVLTTRAVRLALSPRLPDEVAPELCSVAHASSRLVDAAIARLERAVVVEPSRTVTRAIADLTAARALLEQETHVAR